MSVCSNEIIAKKFSLVFGSYDEEIVFEIFLEDVVGGSSAGYSYTFSLSDGVKVDAIVCTEYVSGCIYNLARNFWKFFVEEVFDAYFANETQSLTIFSVCVGKSCLCGNFSDFWFGEVTYREKAVCKLILV
jgi:hypothetical protein